MPQTAATPKPAIRPAVSAQTYDHPQRPVLLLVHTPAPTEAMAQEQELSQQQRQQIAQQELYDAARAKADKAAASREAAIAAPQQQPQQAPASISPVDWAIIQMRGAELKRLGLESSDYRKIADYTAELLAWKARDAQGLCDHYYGTPAAEAAVTTVIVAPRPRP